METAIVLSECALALILAAIAGFLLGKRRGEYTAFHESHDKKAAPLGMSDQLAVDILSALGMQGQLVSDMAIYLDANGIASVTCRRFLISKEAAAVADCISSETLRWRLIEKEGELEGLLWEVVADSQIPALVGDKLIPAGTIETMYQDGRPSFQCQWCYQDVGEGYGHTPECLIVRIHEALATIDEEKDNEPCA